KVKFSLDGIGYTDLDGQRIRLFFDSKQFGNLIYFHATTIEMEEVARSLHATGEAECRQEDAEMVATLVCDFSNYNRRTKEAVREYVNKLIGGK
ncbi:hypothetical protein, partial [Parapedobacter indicus]